jgi:uncharacterized protein YndB with AHSA1/START domain
MSLVTASIQIDAPPERVWETVMNPSHLSEWVTIHRRLVSSDNGPVREGYKMEQQMHLRGVNIDVHWELVECRPGKRAVWQGRGPARSHAHTEYVVAASANGTRFDYRNEFRPPLGPLGAIVSRALVGGMPQREANRSLELLKRHLERSSQTGD